MPVHTPRTEKALLSGNPLGRRETGRRKERCAGAGRPPAEEGANQVLAAFMACDATLRAPVTVQSCAVTGLTVCLVGIPQIPSPRVAHWVPPHRYVYLPCSRKIAQRTPKNVRGGAATPPPNALPQLPLRRGSCVCVNARTASWHPGQGSSIVVQHVPIPGIGPKEVIDDAIYGGDQVISSIKPHNRSRSCQ